MKVVNLDIMVVDEVSQGGYVYPKDVVKGAIDVFNEKYSSEHPCLCDNESNIDVNLAKVSHSINKLVLTDNIVSADIKILDTPDGKIFQDIFNSGVKLNGYASGIGTVDENKSVSDYKFLQVSLNS